jgi:nucleoside-diphosphate-sugar epimerase
MATLVLTGANGFLGCHLLEAFCAAGHHVICLKRSTSDLWRVPEALLPHSDLAAVRWIDVDIAPVHTAFEGQAVDAIVHTACHYGRNGASLADVLRSNLMYGMQVLDAGLAAQVPLFINTDTLLPRTINPYALSKKQFVDWLHFKQNQIQVINLELEHMFGPRDDATKFVSWLIGQMRQQVPEINLTAGTQKRDFIYIADIVSAYTTVLHAAATLPSFSRFEVGSGVATPVKDFILALKGQLESAYGRVDTQLNFGAVPYRDGEIMQFDVNIQPLKDLGWRPKWSIADGLRQIVEGAK